MDHSIQGYLRRRTTEELKLLMNTEEGTVPQEILSLVTEILRERQNSEQAE